MSDQGVYVNVGTEESTLDNSRVTIGNINTGPQADSAELTERLTTQIDDVRLRVRAIEVFLAGTALGEPGLTAQFRDVQNALSRLKENVGWVEQRALQLNNKFEQRFDKLEATIELYEPMWRTLQAQYLKVAPTATYVLYIAFALVVISSFVSIIILLQGK